MFTQLVKDVNAKDDNSWTPLTIASSAGHTEVVKMLLGEEILNNQTGCSKWFAIIDYHNL